MQTCRWQSWSVFALAAAIAASGAGPEGTPAAAAKDTGPAPASAPAAAKSKEAKDTRPAPSPGTAAKYKDLAPAEEMTAAQKAAAELDAILWPKSRPPLGAKEAGKDAKGAVEPAPLPKPPPPKDPTADDLLITFNNQFRAGDRVEAKRTLLKAIELVEKGSPETKYRIANILLLGTSGVEKDPERGRQLLLAAADGGFKRARFDQGWSLLTGGLGFAPDQVKGRKILVDLLAQAEFEPPEVRHQLAMLMCRGAPGIPPELERGLRVMSGLAATGYPPSEFEMGRALLKGLPPVLPADLTRGLNLLRLAANHGVPHAAVLVGEAYERGTGVEADPFEATRWYQLAFDGGLTDIGPALERAKANAADAYRKRQKLLR